MASKKTYFFQSLALIQNHVDTYIELNENSNTQNSQNKAIAEDVWFSNNFQLCSIYDTQKYTCKTNWFNYPLITNITTLQEGINYMYLDVKLKNNQ